MAMPPQQGSAMSHLTFVVDKLHIKLLKSQSVEGYIFTDSTSLLLFIRSPLSAKTFLTQTGRKTLRKFAISYQLLQFDIT